LACRHEACGWYCLTGGCMADEDSDFVCEERRAEMQNDIEWIDWICELVELAEEAGVELATNKQKAYMSMWESGMSVDDVLQGLTDED
jgi:hypothetical protein